MRIPERYDTPIWGLIVIIWLTICTLAIIWAVDQIDEPKPPPAPVNIWQPPTLEA